MIGFLVVHDHAFNDRLTYIKEDAIMSVAQHNGRAIIAYGDDIVVETSEDFTKVLDLMEEVL